MLVYFTQTPTNEAEFTSLLHCPVRWRRALHARLSGEPLRTAVNHCSHIQVGRALGAVLFSPSNSTYPWRLERTFYAPRRSPASQCPSLVATTLPLPLRAVVVAVVVRRTRFPGRPLAPGVLVTRILGALWKGLPSLLSPDPGSCLAAYNCSPAKTTA